MDISEKKVRKKSEIGCYSFEAEWWVEQLKRTEAHWLSYKNDLYA